MIRHPVLDQLSQHGVRLGLDNIRAFLTFLGEPHRAYPVVHVAGTNGKGSVCTFVTSVLVKAGYRVGTTLSPHLQAVNERIQVDGKPIDDARLSEVIEQLDRARTDWAHSVQFEGVPLTYFEFMTAAAFLHFAAVPVDVAVVEVGMGGRLDATNVVRPLVTAITQIGLDHTADLGDDVATIAGEKAGIFKTGVPAVVGPVPAEALATIERRAEWMRAPLWKPGRDLLREHRGDTWNFATPGGTLSKATLGLRGEHQGSNALVALGILHRLREQGFLIPDEAILDGFRDTRLPGRLEELLPSLWVDGAHNEDGAKVLARWLQQHPEQGPRYLLLGMGEGRDPVRFVEPLLEYFDEIVTTRCAHPKARDPLELGLQLEGLGAVVSDGGPIEGALPEIYREADETWVSGSLFLAGAVRDLVAAGALDGIEPGQGPVEPVEPVEG